VVGLTVLGIKNSKVLNINKIFDMVGRVMGESPDDLRRVENKIRLMLAVAVLKKDVDKAYELLNTHANFHFLLGVNFYKNYPDYFEVVKK